MTQADPAIRVCLVLACVHAVCVCVCALCEDSLECVKMHDRLTEFNPCADPVGPWKQCARRQHACVIKMQHVSTIQHVYTIIKMQHVSVYHAKCALSVRFCHEAASSEECEEAAATACCAEELPRTAANVGDAWFGKDWCTIGALPAS